MKNRKNVAVFIVVIAIGIMGMIVFACVTNTEEPTPLVESNSFNKTKNGETERIHILEYSFGTGLYIVEVDDHQYFIHEDGRIYHLESCTCKNK